MCRVRRIKDVKENENNDPVHGPMIEIAGTRISQNFIICPIMKLESSKIRPSLGITLPYLYFVVRVPIPTVHQYQQLHFSFEVTILDDKQMIRRFRASTYQSTTVVTPGLCTFPLNLERQPRRLARDAVLLPTKKQKREDTDDNAYASYDDSNDFVGGDDAEDEQHDNSDENTIPCWNRIVIPLAQYTRRAYGTNYVETMSVQIHPNCHLKRVYFTEKEMHEDDELPEEFRLFHCPS